jgi:hypothetical protein
MKGDEQYLAGRTRGGRWWLADTKGKYTSTKMCCWGPCGLPKENFEPPEGECFDAIGRAFYWLWIKKAIYPIVFLEDLDTDKRLRGRFAGSSTDLGIETWSDMQYFCGKCEGPGEEDNLKRIKNGFVHKDGECWIRKEVK